MEQFKKENLQEYTALKALWSTEKLEIQEFKTDKAWQNVERKATKPKPVSIYRRIRTAAAIAAVFLLVSLLWVTYTNRVDHQPLLVEIADTISPKKVELPDGSVVYLNKSAQLSYPKVFEKNQRTVSLQGEAFFEVAKDVERPFTINTKHAEIEVLGTSFNIDTNEDDTEIIVATGKVKVQSHFAQESAILLPKESALISPTALTRFSTEDQNYLAWKTGKFTFQEQAIKDVISELNTFYQNKLVLSKSATDCLLTASFNKDDLKEILEILQLSCSLQLKENDGRYELH